MRLWKVIKLFLNGGWEKIKTPPKWVLKAYDKWEAKSPRPYNMTKHFAGDNYTYRVKHGMGQQGEAPIIAWHKKNRGLKYPEGIPKNKKNMKRWQMDNRIIYTPKGCRNPFEP